MPEFHHEDVTKKLQKLGLTEHEADIYLSVLRLGEASAGIILGEVKLYREQVYRALKKLTDDGLLTYYVKKKRGYYAALEPRLLSDRIRANLEISESIQPYLKELHQRRPHLIRVNEGADALSLLFDDILATLKAGDEYLVMGGAGERFYGLVKDFFPSYVAQFKKKGIASRMTTYQGEDTGGILSAGDATEIRRLPRSYEVPAATLIYGPKVAIQVFAPDELSVITIENYDVAEVYRAAFETLWEVGQG